MNRQDFNHELDGDGNAMARKQPANRKFGSGAAAAAVPGWAGFTLLLLAGWVSAQNIPGPSYRADYELRFEADWSTQTHPQDFPPNPHFSPLIGGVHDETGSLWQVGEVASDGIEAMAELGATSTLAGEINALIAGGSALSVVQGPGIGLSPGEAEVTFSVNRDFPLISITSMLAPSPDWFVAVDSLDLRDGGGWRDEVVIELFLYDAGTDSGPAYTSVNNDTQPPEAIALISHAPFDNGVALGRFVFSLMATDQFLPLAGEHSGLYSDPARDGEGINLSVAEFADRWAVTVTWFTYLNGEQMWLVGSADFEPGADQITLDLYRTGGTGFGDDFDPTDVVVTLWGQITLRVPQCGFLQVDYTSDDGGESGNLGLRQLVPIGQLDCL